MCRDTATACASSKPRANDMITYAWVVPDERGAETTIRSPGRMPGGQRTCAAVGGSGARRRTETEDGRSAVMEADGRRACVEACRGVLGRTPDHCSGAQNIRSLPPARKHGRVSRGNDVPLDAHPTRTTSNRAVEGVRCGARWRRDPAATRGNRALGVFSSARWRDYVAFTVEHAPAPARRHSPRAEANVVWCAHLRPRGAAASWRELRVRRRIVCRADVTTTDGRRADAAARRRGVAWPARAAEQRAGGGGALDSSSTHHELLPVCDHGELLPGPDPGGYRHVELRLPPLAARHRVGAGWYRSTACARL